MSQINVSIFQKMKAQDDSMSTQLQDQESWISSQLIQSQDNLVKDNTELKQAQDKLEVQNNIEENFR